MKDFNNKYYPLIVVFLLQSFFISCSKRESENPKESILVKIGDSKTISVNEFMRRAEYTVRPPYCKGNSNIDKKIIINSLIAEKLISLEATDTSQILKSEKVKLYLKGIKEQAMRQWLYNQVAEKKVKLDSTAILKTIKVAGRRYNISYFNLPDSSLAFNVNKKLKENKPFKDVFYEITHLNSLPQKELKWSVNEPNAILDSFYTYPLKKNQIIGPIKISKNEYLFAKVNGWIDRQILIEEQFNRRWKDVSEQYFSRKAQKIYSDFILDVMRNKKIEFYPEVFHKIANILGPKYLITDEERKQMLNNSVWKVKDDGIDYASVKNEIEPLKGEPFFKVNNEIYSLDDFIKEVNLHPLVFRKKRIKRKDFGKQLQFAIMDLIRDKYLTEEAYSRGYDNVNIVKRSYKMWKDNFNYIYNKEKYLHSVLPDNLKELDYIVVLDEYLNKYVDSLQTKYSNIIEVDVEKFNKIELSRIDMSVNYNNQPYSRVVPSFPIITTDNKLDYGKKLEK